MKNLFLSCSLFFYFLFFVVQRNAFSLSVQDSPVSWTVASGHGQHWTATASNESSHCIAGTEYLRPILECVRESGQRNELLAVWGYYSEASYEVRHDVVANSNWISGIPRDSQPQPSNFLPGRQVAQFETRFRTGNYQQWVLVAPNGHKSIAEASSASRRCGGSVTLFDSLELSLTL
jgi:hypothetical protein